jgi:glycosyltransferase involved in cell wall biosynthesis
MHSMSGTGATVPATSSAEQLVVAPVSPVPRSLAVGGGNAMFIDGRCVHQESAIKRLEITFDGRTIPAMGWGMPLPERTEGDSYWWGIVEVERIEVPRLAWIELRAELADGRIATGRLGSLDLLPEPEVPEADRIPESEASQRGLPHAGERSVAICMATWEPPRELLERQVESIRQQTHDDWICLISDDASSPEAVEVIREVIGDDPRFCLSASEERRGFYRNFERALAMVPEDARFVALSDQDDRWQPEKLEELLGAIGEGITLAYSDMRIVDEEGSVLSETYWSFRPNNYTDFASLVVANTVTGAASVFDRRLLADALPFPPPLGNAYHDHWIAQIALALGSIAYVPEPLYDYVQHGTAALGHLAANNNGLNSSGRLARARTITDRIRGHGIHPGWRPFYFNIYLRTCVTSRVLAMRVGSRMPAPKRRALKRATPISASNLAWMVGRSARNGISGVTETLGREGAMLRGFLWRGLGEARKRVRRAAPAAAPAPDAFREVHKPVESGLKPILLDYFTRDGSTVMMRLLATSPQIAIEDVYPFERRYFAYFWCWAHVLTREEWNDRSWDPTALASLEDVQEQSVVGPPPWLPRPLLGLVQGETELARRCFDFAWEQFSERVRTVAAETGAPPPRYTAEKHMNTWRIATEQLPPHELVVLLRDPRDSWVSIHSFERGERMGGEDRASEEQMLEHVISRQRERLAWIGDLLAAGTTPVIRYEDLVLDLDGVAARLSELFGIELDPDAVRADGETRERHVSAASPEASIGRWREEMPAEIAARFESELGEPMRELGFEL